MAKSLNLRISGLYTSQNDYGQKPGMLDVADDIVIDQQDLAQSRKGFDALTYNFPDVNDRANRYGVYQNVLISHFGTNSLAYYDDSTGWNVYEGTFDHPDPLLARCRFLQANLNFYLTTSLGIQKLDYYNATVVEAGIPKALDLEVDINGSTGFLTNNPVKTVTCQTTTGSDVLKLLTNDDVSNLLVQQYVSGTNIPDNTQITDISLSTTVLVTTGDLTAGSTTLSNVVSVASLAAGQLVSGNGILPNTRLVSFSGSGPYSVVIDQAAIETSASNPVTFLSDNTVTMSQAAIGTGSEFITFSDGAQIGYRLIWGLRDANNNLLLGVPSPLTITENVTSGTTNIQAIATIPEGITTQHFYQLYRTAATPSATTPPVDQEQLVVEKFPTDTDLTNGYVTILDETPDSLKGQALYTGSDQEGISQANYQPPFSKDFCLFKGFVLYANTSLRQQLKLSIDGVGSPLGVQVGDVITIDGIDFTAASSENVSAGEFQIVTSGSPAQNIADTANSFIRVVNRYSANTTVYAYLLSGPSDLPGQMLLETKHTGGAAFSVTASSNGTAWTPDLPSSGSTVISTQDTETNAIYSSKYLQPESVPQVNLFPVGSKSNSIIRLVPLRDYVVIFTSDGIYRLLGDTTDDFSVQPFDLTTKLIAPETAVPLGNQAWCLANQGVVSVSDGGVQSQSTLQIDNSIRQLFGTALDATAAYAFAVGYETDHRYILGTPQTNQDTSCSQEYCFNYFTEAWTRWTRLCTTGFIHPIENKLYLGNADNNRTVFERKTGTYQDYLDEPNPVSIVSFSNLDVVLSDITGINVGDILTQDTNSAEILAVDLDTNTISVDQPIDWSVGDATYEPAIACSIQWKPQAAGDPTESKQFSEGQIVMRNATFSTGLLSFLSDIEPSFDSVEVLGASSGRWGLFDWGLAPWGGVSSSRTFRFYIPPNKQYAGSLTVKLDIRSGLSAWQLEGIGIVVFDNSFELGK